MSFTPTPITHKVEAIVLGVRIAARIPGRRRQESARKSPVEGEWAGKPDHVEGAARVEPTSSPSRRDDREMIASSRSTGILCERPRAAPSGYGSFCSSPRYVTVWSNSMRTSNASG